MHEWPLFLFTLLMQTTIGAALVLWIYHQFLHENKGKGISFETIKIPLFTMCALSFIGLLASIFHLGYPMHAINAIRNFAHSWLSREIVFTGLFIALLFMTTFVSYKQKTLNGMLLAVTSMIGLIDVYAMASLYADSLVEGWTGASAYITFYTTSFIIGTAFVMTIIGSNKELMASSTISRTFFSLFSLMVIGFVIKLIDLPFFYTKATIMLRESGSALLMTELIVGAIGIGLFAWVLLKGMNKNPLRGIYTALAVLAVSEGIGRYLFYLVVS